MHWLFTALGLLFALLSTWGALVAHWRAQECHGHAQRLATMRSRVTALEGSAESLLAQHRKLSGRFYAMLNELEDPQPPNYPDVDDVKRFNERQAELGQQLLVCENWALACDQGPQSAAARCDCAYCNWQRAERARTRARLVPPTAAGQGAMAKRNSGQPE